MTGNYEYFTTIKNPSTFRTRRPNDSKDINTFDKPASGSDWSTKELFATRLIVQDTDVSRLPGLIKHFDETARSQPGIRELLAGPAAPDASLTETEQVHRLGPSLGPLWAALAKFGDIQSAADEDDDEDDGEDPMALDADLRDAQKRPHSSGSEQSAASQRLQAQGKRARKEPDRPGYVSSQTMQAGSSSPAAPSSQEEGSVGYVSGEHGHRDVPELATIYIASLFIRHVLWNCPPQNDTRAHRPSHLVEFSIVSKQLAGDTTSGTIRATADGELLLYRLGARPTDSYKMTTRRPALLEAKKRFQAIRDGLPVVSDGMLGQLTCQALALRLWHRKSGLDFESVFVIAFVRRFVRFLQFDISEGYVADLARKEEMVNHMWLWATPWLDLENSGGRRTATDHLVALVRQQPALAEQ